MDVAYASGHIHHRALLADKSAVGAINRAPTTFTILKNEDPAPLWTFGDNACHLSPRSGSVAIDSEIRRCAQDDRQVLRSG